MPDRLTEIEQEMDANPRIRVDTLRNFVRWLSSEVKRHRTTDFEDRLGRGEFVETDQLEEMHQKSINGWEDATLGCEWDMRVDVADQAKLTQEVRYWRALHRGEVAPEMKTAEQWEA